MSVFAIADLHLPLGVDKPMDIFGPLWANYVNRLYDNWQSVVKEDDIVIVCGDVSWATYLDEAVADFRFIESLNGTKLISKGNHDYWWETANKLNEYKSAHGFNTIEFLHNNAYFYGDIAICAARGWLSPEDSNYVKSRDERLYLRECIRLGISLDAAKEKSPKKIIAALHYPPGGALLEKLDSEAVDVCVFGHLHAASARDFTPKRDNHFLVSADCLGFMPKKIM